MIRILQGDCRDVMRTLDAASVDAIVCDPPYGLGFMGREWDSFASKRDAGSRGGSGDKGILPGYGRGGTSADRVQNRHREGTAYQEWSELWAIEALRVLKPGGHLLAFSGTRTYHRMVCAIEDAGFEVRDQIGWLYGSGFPKSLDVSKAIDKAAGVEREVIGHNPKWNTAPRSMNPGGDGAGDLQAMPAYTAPATDAARQWQGWGTALKPAFEPIVLARKPLVGNVATNVLQHGTGALNIDACRVPADEGRPAIESRAEPSLNAFGDGLNGSRAIGSTTLGRWPANVIHDGSEDVVASFPLTGPSPKPYVRSVASFGVTAYGPSISEQSGVLSNNYADSGSAARFFYTAKASAFDRNDGTYDLPARANADWPQSLDGGDKRGAKARGNHHPTVKPTDLMRYLCRLVTPPGGLVLDPFMGSGSTLKAAELEGFSAIGIELDPAYIAIARRRIASDMPLFQGTAA